MKIIGTSLPVQSLFTVRRAARPLCFVQIVLLHLLPSYCVSVSLCSLICVSPSPEPPQSPPYLPSPRNRQDISLTANWLSPLLCDCITSHPWMFLHPSNTTIRKVLYIFHCFFIYFHSTWLKMIPCW